MNERIKELAESIDPIAWRQQHPDDDAWCMKFAELIIRECLGQVRDEVQYISDWDKAEQIINTVKKHFGVK